MLGQCSPSLAHPSAPSPRAPFAPIAAQNESACVTVAVGHASADHPRHINCEVAESESHFRSKLYRLYQHTELCVGVNHV